MENEFNKSFNDHFYISLISLKEYAKKNNKCIIGYFFEKKLKEKTMNLIRKILLQYFININKIESFNKISFLINEQDFSSFSLNNFEIFGILDILCNFEDNTFFDIENIIINIKYDNITDNLLEYFSTINFEKIFEKKNNKYCSFIIIMINNLLNIKGYNLIFILVDKIKKCINKISFKKRCSKRY